MSGSDKQYVYEPELGHYDNANASVIAQHVTWFQRAGLNTAVLDTWITDRDWDWVLANSVPVMDAFEKKHAPIQDYFCTGVGIDLQYEESQLAEQIMLHFARQAFRHIITIARQDYDTRNA